MRGAGARRRRALAAVVRADTVEMIAPKALVLPVPLLPVVCTARLPAEPPAFSWETVPVFMHSGNRSGLSATTARFMSRFPMVTMGGFQGSQNPGGNEAAITPFAQAVKRNNRSAHVLYYQNALINFPQTRLGRANSTLPSSLLLHDAKGRLVYLGGCGGGAHAPNHTVYDHSQPEMRAAWTANIVDVVQAPVNDGLIDGVFCDRSGPITAVISKYLSCYEFDEGFAQRWDDGHWQAVADTQTALNRLLPTAIVVANHASPKKSMHLEPTNATWNAKMYEHFTPVKAAGMDYVPTGNQLRAFMDDGGWCHLPTPRQVVAWNTTQYVVVAWLVVSTSRGTGPDFIDEVHVDHCRVDMGPNSSHTPQNLRDMYRRSLAAFLIGASEYSYYACTNGWGFHLGWQHWSPDYDRPLGHPLGYFTYSFPAL